MGKEFPFAPRKTEKIHTRNRIIRTPIPVPASRPIIETLRRFEPASMRGQPLVIWDRAFGVHVYDRWGNKWLDFSSGVLVANAGHGIREVEKAIVRTAAKPLHHNYCFPSAERAALARFIIEQVAPPNLDRVFLLTTGSEAAENAIKVCRANSHRIGGPKKNVILSFESDFHGRTLGSQLAGGIPALKEWIIHRDPDFVNVPCPDGFRGKDQTFDGFLRELKRRNVRPKNIAGLFMETYQGGSAILLPAPFMKELRRFLDENRAMLIFDEVQSGIGRTGKMLAFEHYGVKADLVCLGKGISSGLPLAAVLGHSSHMDLFPPGSMTSTHTGNPIICAAALANLQYIRRKKLVENSARLGKIMRTRVQKIWRKYPGPVGHAASTGLVGAMQLVARPGTTDPNPDTAFAIVRHCIEHGLMLFAPVGNGGASVKLSPPLSINESQLNEGFDVLEAAFAAVLQNRK